MTLKAWMRRWGGRLSVEGRADLAAVLADPLFTHLEREAFGAGYRAGGGSVAPGYEERAWQTYVMASTAEREEI